MEVVVALTIPIAVEAESDASRLCKGVSSTTIKKGGTGQQETYEVERCLSAIRRGGRWRGYVNRTKSDGGGRCGGASAKSTLLEDSNVEAG